MRVNYTNMFQCAWCKKKTNVDEWSADKEPLCSECALKYNFGLEQEMIKGNVSGLSKEQRREISERMNNFERFWGALRSVEKEILVGQAKILSHITGWFLFIVFLLGVITFSDWFSNHDFLGLIIIPTYIFLAYLLYQRIVWHIKYWQLKRKVRESGYGGI